MEKNTSAVFAWVHLRCMSNSFAIAGDSAVFIWTRVLYVYCSQFLIEMFARANANTIGILVLWQYDDTAANGRQT